MNDGQPSTDSETLVQLALEMWKLLRAFERVLSEMPEEKAGKRRAQLRYSKSKLDTLLDNAGLRILLFDGQKYSANLPISPLNSEEVDGPGDSFVESTIEPTIIGDNSIFHTGKVMLTGENNVSGN